MHQIKFIEIMVECIHSKIKVRSPTSEFANIRLYSKWIQDKSFYEYLYLKKMIERIDKKQFYPSDER
jgi:hypothetical protein